MVGKDQAIQLVKELHPDMVCEFGAELKNGYIITTYPEGVDRSRYTIPSRFVYKDNGRIEIYSPMRHGGISIE